MIQNVFSIVDHCKAFVEIMIPENSYEPVVVFEMVVRWLEIPNYKQIQLA